jgi:transglutaminase-like putative cysteine protease
MIDPSYLRPATYIDSDHADVIAYARAAAGDAPDPVEAAKRLYLAVRDDIFYDPYVNVADVRIYHASTVLKMQRAYCIPKAALLAAAARALGIPARVGYADVRNHLATPRLLELIGGDIFHWHGFVELYLEGKWVKATPTFNLELCERFRVKPLEFDGRSDSLFHAYDQDGRRHMEYIAERGIFADVPVAQILEDLKKVSPLWFAGPDGGPGGDLMAEAEALS